MTQEQINTDISLWLSQAVPGMTLEQATAIIELLADLDGTVHMVRVRLSASQLQAAQDDLHAMITTIIEIQAILSLTRYLINPSSVLPVDAEAAAEPRRCHICGCDDDHACMDSDGRPCHWVAGNLCSACAAKQALAEKEVEPCE